MTEVPLNTRIWWRLDAAEAEFDSPIFEVDIKPESLCILRLCRRQNPVFRTLCRSQDMLKYQDTYYLYPTTDGFANWSGTQFHAFSSRDMREWKDEGVILDAASEQVPWSAGSAWAPAFFRGQSILLLFLREKAGWGILYRCCGKQFSRIRIPGTAKTSADSRNGTGSRCKDEPGDRPIHL